MSNSERRNKGQFYTPTLFVDYAHKMIAEQFGEDWKEKFVVWDNCSGTKNLTRDYYFKELYCSTLENAELAISERYNKEATSFQFDFLNDSLDKLPQGLKDALEQNKPIIFFINPPYAQAGNGKTDGTNKGGCAKTIVNQQMKDDKIGASSQNLYAQFLYRIMKIKEQYSLTNCHICLFSPSVFLSGSSWKGFRVMFFNNFTFVDGVQFKASHFADVADTWGISFSIWNNGVNSDNNNFNYKVIDNIDGEIKVIGNKTLYNLDGKGNLNKWIASSVKETKTNECIAAKSAINVSESAKKVGTELGYLVNDRNNVYASIQDVYFMTMPITRHLSIIDVRNDNFNKCVALFSARKIVNKDWSNAEDEFLIPNEGDERYNEFVNDSIIYSLFSAFSQQSSLRNVNDKYNIKNEFFFMSKDDIKELANESNLDYTYNDANVSAERYVYTKLQGIELSPEAQEVLNKAIELTKRSFRYREMFNDEHPEYQILNWDASYYQLKAMWKEYMPQEYKEFTNVYKKLADKMRPMVYELGFLK